MFKYKVLSGIHHVNGKMNRAGDVVVLARKVEELWPSSAGFFEFVGEFTPEVADVGDKAQDGSDASAKKQDADLFEGLIFPEEKIVGEDDDATDEAPKPESKSSPKPTKRRARRKTAVVGDA